MTSHNQAITAMCLWEAFIEAPEGTYPGLAAYRDGNGSVAARDFVLQTLAPLADAAWEALCPDREPLPWAMAYDFDFCPLALSVLDDDLCSLPMTVPDTAGLLAQDIMRYVAGDWECLRVGPVRLADGRWADCEGKDARAWLVRAEYPAGKTKVLAECYSVSAANAACEQWEAATCPA